MAISCCLKPLFDLNFFLSVVSCMISGQIIWISNFSPNNEWSTFSFVDILVYHLWRFILFDILWITLGSSSFTSVWIASSFSSVVWIVPLFFSTLDNLSLIILIYVLTLFSSSFRSWIVTSLGLLNLENSSWRSKESLLWVVGLFGRFRSKKLFNISFLIIGFDTFSNISNNFYLHL